MSDIFGVGSAVQAGATLGAAAIQADAANNAADKQYQAAHEANQLQTQIYGETVTRNKPFYDTGTSALDTIAGLYGLNGKTQSFDAFTASPDYQFRFDQGIKGIDAGATARGMLDSGATRKAELKYAGNLASGEFNNYADRLMGLARVGQSAANNTSSAGQDYASAYGTNISNAAVNAGNAGLYSGATWGNALGNLAGQFGSSYGGSRSPGVPNYNLTGQSSGPEFGWT
jgi:hypothetical protein